MKIFLVFLSVFYIAIGSGTIVQASAGHPLSPGPQIAYDAAGMVIAALFTVLVIAWR
jgi:hypothetical protein